MNTDQTPVSSSTRPAPAPTPASDSGLFVGYCLKCGQKISIFAPYRRIKAVKAFGRHPGYDALIHDDCPVR